MIHLQDTKKEDFDFSKFADDLEGDFDSVQTSNPANLEREKFPCEACCGSGLWKPGVASYGGKLENKCHPCKGRGYFYSTKYDRMQKSLKSQQSKAAKLLQAQEAFEESNPGLRAFLQGASSWSSFAHSLSETLNTKGGLSDKAIEAAVSMKTKSDARQAERSAEKLKAAGIAASVAEATVPTLARLAESFLTSSASLKFPKLRLRSEEGQKVVLSRCGAGSKTPGSINITDGGKFGENKYFGRIDPDGKAFYKDITADVLAVLNAFNNDPEAEIKVQGLRTGECCCCGKELTDPVSIEAGIGPICAEKWGF